MYERTTEQLFELWRHTNDVRALGEAFDRTAPQLMRLARRLSRDRADAEDLVQATWLAAIEAAARFEAGRSLDAWLVGILVRQAGLARRRAQRAQSGGELDSARDDDPAAPVEAREFAEALTRSLARLTPSEREVLMPLLLDDKRIAEIARELDKHPQAIHVRARRGLARLRHMLAPGFGLGLVALLDRRALARVREQVLASTGQSVGVAAAVSPWALGGLLLVNKLVLWCLAVAALALTLWSTGILHSLGTGSPRVEAIFGEPDQHKPALQLAEAAREEARVALTPDRPEEASSTAIPVPARWLVRGRIQGIAPEETRSASLRIRPFVLDRKAGAPISVTVDAHDEFVVDVSSFFTAGTSAIPTDLWLEIDHPGYLVASERIHTENGTSGTEPGETSETVYRWDPSLILAAVVRVRILAPKDSKDSTCWAEMFAFTDGKPDTHTRCESSANSGDEVLLRMRKGGEFVIQAWSESSTAATAKVVADLGRESRLPDIQLESGLAISGVVVGAGAPQPGLQVVCYRMDDPPPGEPANDERELWWENGRFKRPAGSAVSDASGHFTISGLEAGLFGLQCTGCLGGCEAWMSAGATRDRSGLKVRAPAVDVVVPVTFGVIEFRFSGLDAHVERVPVRIIQGRGMTESMSNNSAAFRYGYMPGVTATFEFDVPGYISWVKQVTVPAAGTEQVEYVGFEARAGGRLTIQLTNGHATRRALVRFEKVSSGSEEKPAQVRSLPDECTFIAGSTVIDDLPIGTYQVTVRPGAARGEPGGYYVDKEFTIEISTGCDVVHALDMDLGGRVRLLVKRRAEDSPEVAFKLVASDGSVLHPDAGQRTNKGYTSHGGWLVSGEWELEPALPAGRYRIITEERGQAPREFAFTVTTGETTEVALDLDAN